MIDVGIDCDGVLRHFAQHTVDIVKEKTGIELVADRWGFMNGFEFEGRPLYKYVFADWAEEVFTKAPVIENALAGYNKFCSDPNFHVSIVTTQSKSNEELTKIWLKENGFVHHDHIQFERNKLKANCQVLIDDKVENVKAYNENSRMGILQRRPWNEGYNPEYVVSNLLEAYDILKQWTNT